MTISPEKRLTTRQQECLERIAFHLANDPQPPTIQMIADEMELALSSTYLKFEALEYKGYIRRVSRSRQALRLTEFGRQFLVRHERETK